MRLTIAALAAPFVLGCASGPPAPPPAPAWSLEASARADALAARLAAAPLAGPYRVGVDFQERCTSDERVAPWVIQIDARGERRVLRGLARWNVFDSRVDELVIDRAER